MTRKTAMHPSNPAQAALPPSDVCLVAVFALGMRRRDRCIGTDEQISAEVKKILPILGVQDVSGPVQLGSDGKWYLEEVAAYTDRLATLDWATTDSPYRFTPHGYRRCAQALQVALDTGRLKGHDRQVRAILGMDVKKAVAKALK